jgi:hypothetical protein
MHTSIEDRQVVGDHEQHPEPALSISFPWSRCSYCFVNLPLRGIYRGSRRGGRLLGYLALLHTDLWLVSVSIDQNRAHLMLPYVKEVVSLTL